MQLNTPICFPLRICGEKMIEQQHTKLQPQRRIAYPLAYKSVTVILFIASFCRGATVRAGSASPGRGSQTVDKSSFFSWEAFIHGSTGEATSNERSGPFSLMTEKSSLLPLFAKKKPHLSKNVDCDSKSIQEKKEEWDRSMKEEERLVVETSRQFVETWPDFLCQGSISFGILSCRKENNKNATSGRRAKWRSILRTNPLNGITATESSTLAGSSSLLPRFAPFPVKLLEFGRVIQSPPSTVDHSRSNEVNQKSPDILASWHIPLQGGALILGDNKSQQHQSGSSRSGSSANRGKLVFAIAKTRRLHDSEKLDTSIESYCEDNTYQIITGIRGYYPWLAGGGYTSKSEGKKKHESIWSAIKDNRETTTRRLCHAFYLSTQSMVHAYMTWRFHNSWKQRLKTVVQASKTKADNGIVERVK